jgi:hypothetical protein
MTAGYFPTAGNNRLPRRAIHSGHPEGVIRVATGTIEERLPAAFAAWTERDRTAEEARYRLRGNMGNRPEAAAGFLSHRGLIAFAAGAAIAEAALLTAFAPAARGLAPQVTAVPPLAVFHDLRWLYGAQRSWLQFALLLAGLALARSAVNALLARLAWPRWLAPPPPRAALLCALAFTVFAFLLMSPMASLALGVAVLPFSWPFLGTLPILLLIAVTLSHGGVASSWWRMLPPLGAVGWLLADFAVLSLAAAAMGRLPAAGAIAAAGLAGLVNARAWYGLTGAVARAVARDQAGAGGHPPGLLADLHRIPSVPLATVAVMALVTLTIRLAFLVSVPAEHAPQPVAGQGAAAVGTIIAAQQTATVPVHSRWSRRPPVLVVPGFGSYCCMHGQALAKAMPDTLVQTFSYRGLDAAGRPLPYGPAASNVSLPVLGDRIAAQVWRLHERTGEPVDVVAESEGSLGVYAMLARHPHAPVAAVALLSPIVAPGQVSYPVGGGSALLPGSELQAVVWFVGGLSPFGTSGAQTLIGSVNQVGARFAAQAARDHRLPWLDLVPLADAVTLPDCRLPANVLVVPAFHGDLLGDPMALRIVRGFLLRHRATGTARLRTAAELVASAASAWRIPLATAPSPPCRQ